MRGRVRALAVAGSAGAVLAGIVVGTADGVPTAPTGSAGTAVILEGSTRSAPNVEVSPRSRGKRPAYAFSVRRAKKRDVRTWRRGCPVPRRHLRVATVRYWGFDKKAHDGTLVVNRDVVRDVRKAFRRIYRKRFPIKRMRNIDHYDGKDRRSMRRNNTSAFNCRKVAGSSSWSNHAYGRAIDINPRRNPYVWSGGFSPRNGEKYLDRSNHRKGMVGSRSVVVRAFRSVGWQWGGFWRSPDYQHVDRPR